ncbi:glycosyltransferase family 117 protein [Myroides sp. LJL119]
MLTFNYKKWNIIGGWFCFLIALITYCLTVEPTVSFWDPGEYIATSAKLQVGHPPGAPLYQMLGAFFSMFASSPDKIALMVNMVAVISSAFTILFMFWISSNILKKVIEKTSTLNNINAMVILASAAIGSLAFTFSDSFWFNAVESEVYASAMFLISLLLYLGLRWVDDLDKPRGDKWLLLIALISGCSFGIHLMGLLTIPSIVLLYYFKKYKKITPKNFILANLTAIIVLFFLFAFLFPYILALFGKTEIFMVNSLGLPFNSGTIFAFILIVAFFVIGLKFTSKKNYVFANTLILALLFVCIGLTSWIMLPIRANAKVVINENTPSDAAELLAYYQREQYGSESIYYDSYFTKLYVGLDKDNPFKDEKPNYERDYKTGKYIIVNEWKNAGYNFNSKHKGFLPRLWSTDTNHRLNYMRYTRPLDFSVKSEYAGTPELEEFVREVKQELAANNIGVEELDQIFQSEYAQYLDIAVPSFMDNMSFMVNYQFGYMFWRYLMWNFAGRQDDIQGQGDLTHGNWISGIKFLDQIRLGSQDNLPDTVLNNKARNTYFMIPFILGVVGFIFHFRNDKRTFWVLLVLFLFTSLALKVFLNERPFEPRERDYAVVPAFFVFAIWLGFGVYAIYQGVSKYLNPKLSAAIVLTASLLGAPVLMAQQNWDDHDRSNKYTALANAKAYLDSCEPNAILFTIGDNDTFPLWYLQDVEGYRTDVRVVCTSLLPLDWYIDQMRAKAYQSEALPIKFTHDQYVGNKRDYVLIQPITDKAIDINLFLDFIRSEDERLKTKTQAGITTYIAPTNKLTIPVNKDIISKNNIVSPYLMDQVVDTVHVEIKDSGLYKHRLIMLDIIANNKWERPIYFSGGSYGDEDYLWMKDYLQLNGLTYQLVPIKSDKKSSHPLDMGSIDSDRMYNVIKDWYWGNMGSDKIYHDPQTRKNSNYYRINLARLQEQLIQEGKLDKAEHVIDIAMQNMPLKYYNEHRFVQSFIEGYYKVGKPEKARELVDQTIEIMKGKIDYYKSLPVEDLYYYAQDLKDEVDLYGLLMQIVVDNDKENSQELTQEYMNTVMQVKNLGQFFQEN